MNSTLREAHQWEMRLAHYDGAPGMLVSGVVWVIAALVCYRLDVAQGIWALLIGGAMIHPIGTIVTRLLGRSIKTSKDNALIRLAAASTIWLIVCCIMAYGLSRLNPGLFFPAMIATIGSRYLVFATVFGLSLYWVLGAILIAAANLAFFTGMPPAQSALLGGLIEIAFAALMFSRAAKAGVWSIDQRARPLEVARGGPGLPWGSVYTRTMPRKPRAA